MSEHLLPPANVTPLEAALDLAIETPVLATPAPIRDLWRPETCPAHLLDHLAWGLGVDLWEAAWPEGRKRRMCREAWELKRLKGTLEGVRRILPFVDAELVTARLPPRRFRPLAPNPARQARFLARFAEIRVYRQASRRPARGAAFLLGYGYLDHVHVLSPTPRRSAKRAVLLDAGAETEIEWRGAQLADGLPAETVTIAGRHHPGDPRLGRMLLGHAYLTRPGRSRRIDLTPGALSGGLSVTAPEEVRPTAPGRAGALRLGGFVGGHVAPAAYETRNHQRRRLIDPARAPHGLSAGRAEYLGVARLGMAAFSAHFSIRATARSTHRAIRTGGHIGGYLMRPRGIHARVARALRAVSVRRDRLTFTTQTHAPIRFDRLNSFAGVERFDGLQPITRAA